jgi:hypothetical protein
VTILERIYLVFNDDPDRFILQHLLEHYHLFMYAQYLFKIYTLDITKLYTTSTILYYFHLVKVRKVTLLGGGPTKAICNRLLSISKRKKSILEVFSVYASKSDKSMSILKND